MNEPDHLKETPDARILRVHKEHIQFLYVVARACGMCQSDVDDVIYNVLFKMWCHLCNGGAIDRSSERAWLAITVRNESNGCHRRIERGLRQLRVLTERIKEPTNSDSVVSQVVRNEEQHALQMAIESLPSECRCVLEACDLEGLKLAEYARRAGIPYRTAKRLRKRALHFLYKSLNIFV